MMRHASLLLLAVCSSALLASGTALADNLSNGGHVETDLWTNAESPPAALLDGDTKTHFAQYRLEDSEWRVVLGQAGTVTAVTLVQGWSDWSQVLELELESADGTVLTIQPQAGTRDPQTFSLAFPGSTAFIDVRVTKASVPSSGEGWGGFAELTFEGTPAAPDSSAPKVSGITVEKAAADDAWIRWSTDEPATSQVRFSTESEFSVVTAPDLTLSKDHAVRVNGHGVLRGKAEIRSADATGNRAEQMYDAFPTVDTAFQFGVGGWSFHLGDKWVPAQQVYASDGVKLGFMQTWIGGDSWQDWFKASSLTKVVADGYTPDIIHYYFGDPVLSDVQARHDAFLADIQALAALLQESGVGNKTIVTLEPEFNQGEVAQWEGWNDLMIEAMTILRAAGAKVGVLPGDWDIQHYLPLSMGRAAAYSDFVAFQEMRASTQDTTTDAAEVVDHAIRFSHYLNRKFLRPVRWGYAMVSDYGGWEWVQRDMVIELCERYQELQGNGVVAVSWMSYLDSPGSSGYFGEAEAHKGLKYSDSTPKPAFHVWKECTLNGPSWLATGQEPPGAPPPSDDSGCGCKQGPRGSSGLWTMGGIARRLLGR